MIKVLIVDDEAPARALIKEYLADYSEMVVIGECNNGVDAVRMIREFQPELLFLDIQMPGLTGFDVLKKLDEMPQTIFSTAYDKYALKAFEVHAVDYLLKPYTRERFSKAVMRVLEKGDRQLDSLQSLAQKLLETKERPYPDKILISSGRKLVALGTDEVIWIQAEKDYSRLISGRGNFLSSLGIGQLEEKLDPNLFLRVHRSSIIHVNFIKEIFKYGSGYDIRMTNGDVVRVSRSYMDKIKRLTI